VWPHVVWTHIDCPVGKFHPPTIFCPLPKGCPMVRDCPPAMFWSTPKFLSCRPWDIMAIRCPYRYWNVNTNARRMSLAHICLSSSSPTGLGNIERSAHHSEKWNTTGHLASRGLSPSHIWILWLGLSSVLQHLWPRHIGMGVWCGRDTFQWGKNRSIGVHLNKGRWQ